MRKVRGTAPSAAWAGSDGAGDWLLVFRSTCMPAPLKENLRLRQWKAFIAYLPFGAKGKPHPQLDTQLRSPRQGGACPLEAGRRAGTDRRDRLRRKKRAPERKAAQAPRCRAELKAIERPPPLRRRRSRLCGTGKPRET